ncbi:MAG: acyl-ACP--UDP-N-acetylglucosamine O-acyltransferase [Hyphomicrobiaceae bacterium]|nr:acyl-ACP--UDP-N-acetylglucosamine O-acyltransferase [Hyphomicrobiaceae bacterium]
MTNIHSSSVVDPKANLGSGVEVGPFCVIGPDVTLGDDCKLHSHVVIEGQTTLGAKCEVFPFASLGHIPQDMKYGGEKSELVIGDNNRIREYVTMNPGTEGGGLVTRVGSDCLFMAQSHVAHDCVIGSHVILANGATLAGHCVVGDYAILGGLSAVHQFVRIGDHAFIGGMSGVENDVIPYGMVVGPRASLKGLNVIGIKRRGFDREQLRNLREAYDNLFAEEGTLVERVEAVEKAFPDDEHITSILEFIRAESSRSLSVPKQDTA